MLTIAYARVSTDDQIEHSPEAQRRRCAEFARSNGLGVPTFLSDEGISGKDLDRPAMRELLDLVRTDQVAHLIVWRLDRLSRDNGDLSTITRLLQEHCVDLHSLNEGEVQIATASGRLQVGMHGVIAQFQREQTIENSKLGSEQAARTGYWINRPPMGYDLLDRVLVPNDDAHIMRRIFKLRAAGMPYAQIEEATGIKYSTVRHACHNRAYLGLTRHGDNWYAGRHEPLVSEADFDTIQRQNVSVGRKSKDLLSGRVTCGNCGRRASIDTNERGQRIYRCWNRGKGCRIPGRSANGLHRAARLGINELRNDDSLYEGVRDQLRARIDRAGGGDATASRSGAIAKLRNEREKLLALYLDDKITNDYFAEKERRITARIDGLETDQAEAIETVQRHNALADAFEQAAALLRDPAFDFETIWDHANDKERRVLVEELIETVTIYADRLEVTVTGAPPLLVTLDEVGLRSPGTGTVVSEGRHKPQVHGPRGPAPTQLRDTKPLVTGSRHNIRPAQAK